MKAYIDISKFHGISDVGLLGIILDATITVEDDNGRSRKGTLILQGKIGQPSEECKPPYRKELGLS